MANHTSNTPAPDPEGELLPRHSASEQPVSRLTRIAFHVWVMCVTLTVVVALVLFLFDKIYFAVTGR